MLAHVDHLARAQPQRDDWPGASRDIAMLPGPCAVEMKICKPGEKALPGVLQAHEAEPHLRLLPQQNVVLEVHARARAELDVDDRNELALDDDGRVADAASVPWGCRSRRRARCRSRPRSAAGPGRRRRGRSASPRGWAVWQLGQVMGASVRRGGNGAYPPARKVRPKADGVLTPNGTRIQRAHGRRGQAAPKRRHLSEDDQELASVEDIGPEPSESPAVDDV